MTQEKFDNLTAISQPHRAFNLDWTTYSAQDYGDAFLPNTPLFRTDSLTIHDGGGLFSGFIATKNAPQLLSVEQDALLISVFTFPQGVLAQDKIDALEPVMEDLILLVSTDIKDELSIRFKFGQAFIDNLRNSITSEQLHVAEETSFKSTADSFRSDLDGAISNSRLIQFTYKTLGIDIDSLEYGMGLFYPKNPIPDEPTSMAFIIVDEECGSTLLDEFVPFLKSLNFGTVSQLDGELEFYRSKDQSKGKSGIDDTTYLGKFGFDRYDINLDGDGSLSQKYFPEIPEVKKEYRAQIVALWPPKSKIPSTVIQDPSFQPVTKVDIWFKVTQESGKNTAKTSAPIQFVTGSTAIKINGLNSGTLINGASPYAVGDTGSFQLECTDVLRKHEFVVFRETDVNGRIIGVLVIVPNENVHTTTVHFIDTIKANQTLLTPGTGTHYLSKPLKSFCNTQAFNQSFIYVDIDPKTEKLSVNKDLLLSVLTDTTGRNYVLSGSQNLRSFHESVLRAYNGELQRISGDTLTQDIATINKMMDAIDADSNRKTGIDKSDLRKSMKSLAKLTLKKFRQYRKKEELVMGKVFTDPEVIAALHLYKDERLKYRQELIKLVFAEIDTKPNNTHLKVYKKDIETSILAGANVAGIPSNIQADDSSTIFMFLYKGINDFRSSETSTSLTAGFTLTDRGFVHMLDYALSKTTRERQELIAHEMGHAFSLEHTFDPDHQKNEINDKYDKQLEDANKDKKRGLENLAKKTPSKTTLKTFYTRFQSTMERMVDFSETWKLNRDLQTFDFEFNQDVIDGRVNNERSINGYTKTVADIENAHTNRVANIEENRKNDLVDTVDIALGKTEENFMDYNVSQMNSFWYWQWVKMQCGGSPLKKHTL